MAEKSKTLRGKANRNIRTRKLLGGRRGRWEGRKGESRIENGTGTKEVLQGMTKETTLNCTAPKGILFRQET